MLDLAPDLTQAAGWMPIVFLVVMGLAMLAYVILDGYDLGVGVLMHRASDDDKDTMIASIGPFWDANETWLVLGVGILLTVFPLAHGVILGALYLPVAFMLIGLTLRGVAFDFRVKARASHKPLWNRMFYTGSLLASWSQGYMLGSLVTGFATTWWTIVFNAVIGLALVAAYCLLGAGWLIIKSEGELQLRAVRWARTSLWHHGRCRGDLDRHAAGEPQHFQQVVLFSEHRAAAADSRRHAGAVRRDLSQPAAFAGAAGTGQ
jgi:cytochrome d ubiquinol oxidase subunit II